MDRKASIPSINLFRESAESPQEGLPKKMAGSKYHHSHTGYECQTEPEKILQQDSIYPEALEHVIRNVRKDFKGDIILRKTASPFLTMPEELSLSEGLLQEWKAVFMTGFP